MLDEFEKDYVNEQKYVIESSDCMLLTMMWIYFMKQNHWNMDATQVKPLKQEARKLKDKDMDRYWLFCCEALKRGSLAGQWWSMKKVGVSFINKEVFGSAIAGTEPSKRTACR